jgi:hypothetical protein
MKNFPRFSPRVLALPLLVSLVLPLVSQAAEKDAAFRAALESITPADLLDRDKVLADEKMAGREAGTEGGTEARKYLIEQYTKFKLLPGGIDGKFEQPLPPNYCNVVGLIPGRDPALKNEYVLLEAHYDHVGLGHRMSYDPGAIHPGADDNGSGSSALIELAEAFTFLAEPPKRSILILATDGEEKGLVGSKYWAKNPTVPVDKVVAGLNLDMIGRMREDTLYIYGTRTGAGWRRLISEQNDDPRLKLDFGWSFQPNSDSYPLFEKGIPALLFHTGVHENYHRTSDTPDRLDSEGMSRIVRLAFRLTNELAERPDRLAHRAGAHRETERMENELIEQCPAPPSRLGVTVETAPSGDLPGVKITKIDADSPAARAGLKEGDRILEFAGREVKTPDELIGAVVTAANAAKATVRGPSEEKSREVEIELNGKPMRLGFTWRVDEAEPKAVILTHVLPGTPAAMAGLKSGDRVYQISGRDFADENEFIRAAKEASDKLDLLIERNGRIQVLHLDLKAGASVNREA